MKQKHEQEIAMDIDYELFTTEEIVRIFQFYSLVTKTKYQQVSKQELIQGYHDYQNIIHNIALQKKYDAKFEKVTGISIYKIMQKLENFHQ